jgi:hypothetical protein
MRIVLSLLLAATLTVPTAAFAGNKGKKAHDDSAAQGHTSEAVVSLITVTERTIIFDYVNQYRDTLVLAPGSAKPLPPGIAKRYLPQDLLGQLPPRPGYQWVVVDNDVALIAVATGLIVDILADIL